VELILDGHPTHVTPRVVAYAGFQGLSLIRSVSHSSHITQLFDMCVFSLLKTIYYKDRKPKVTKGGTRKIHRTLFTFYKATIIPMVRWNFEKVGFLLKLEDITEIQCRLFQAELWIKLVLPALKWMTRLFTVTI
jgi:hypothetical protein